MSIKDIISQLLERGLAMQTYWGFYITISLGLIVFFGNAKRSARLPYLAALVSIVFVGFAYVNCTGMIAVSGQRNFLYHLLSTVGTAEGIPTQHASDALVVSGFLKLAKPDAPDEVKWFHIACDVAVLTAIWFLVLWHTGEELSFEKSSESPKSSADPKPEK